MAWADGGSGSYAELVRVPADRAVPVPAGVQPPVAAAALLQGMTAHFLSHDTYPLGRGSRCLIHAAAGGVGLLLVQMAKAAGAEVFATVGSPEKGELARGAGADHVILYRDEDFATAVERIAGPRPLDVVYDGVGRATFERGLDLLRPRGMMVTFGNASGPVDPVSPLTLMNSGSLFLTRPTLRHYVATTAELRERAGASSGRSPPASSTSGSGRPSPWPRRGGRTSCWRAGARRARSCCSPERRRPAAAEGVPWRRRAGAARSRAAPAGKGPGRAITRVPPTG